MLAKKNRLCSKREFDLVYKKGKNFQSDYLYSKVLLDSANLTKIGFVISKKVASKATTRNRAKRILRAAAREVLNRLEKANIMIIVKRMPKEDQFVNLAEDFKRILSKAGVLK